MLCNTSKIRNTFSQLALRSKQFVFFTVVLLFCASGILNAQAPKGFNVELHSHFGKVILHTPELIFDSPPLTTGLDINFTWQTHGKKKWHQFQRYPKIGGGLMTFSMGERDTLGNAYGLHYNFTIPLIWKERFKMRFQFASGLAILDRPFNRISNPNNNAIGSKLNVIAHMKFIGQYQFHKNWALSYGGSFTHFSNGAAQLPNFGINIGSGTVGLIYTPQPLESADYIRQDVSKKGDKKLGIRFEYSLGFRESQTFGGPRYPIKVYTLAGVYQLNRINRIFFGTDYEINRAVQAFGEATFAFNSDREAFWGARRITVFIADEFVFGNFGLTMQAGTYLGNFSYQVPNFLYVKLIGRYYVKVWDKPETRLFAGIMLKSHFSIAEYFALNVGIEF